MTGKVTVASTEPAKKDPTLNAPGHDNKYGRVYAEEKSFHDGEPVFVIRGQDPLAPHALRMYAELCEVAGCPGDHTISSLDAAAKVELWQAANSHLVKEKPG